MGLPKVFMIGLLFERSIGVTTEINQEWISTGADANRCDYDTHSSYFDGAYLDDWSPNKTIQYH